MSGPAHDPDRPRESVPPSELRDLAPEPTGVGVLGARALELVDGKGSRCTRSSSRRSTTARGAGGSKGAVVPRCTRSATDSLFFLTVVMGFIGMILVLQAGIQTKRIIPELSLLGAAYLES